MTTNFIEVRGANEHNLKNVDITKLIPICLAGLFCVSKEVILDISYNPKLLGGLIVEYNSTSIDASILKEFSLFFSEI